MCSWRRLFVLDLLSKKTFLPD
jgi:hypothetical protein